MKIAATASYNAVPSIFTVAPTGMTNLTTRASTLLFVSRQRIVTGIVAELLAQKKMHYKKLMQYDNFVYNL